MPLQLRRTSLTIKIRKVINLHRSISRWQQCSAKFLKERYAGDKSINWSKQELSSLTKTDSALGGCHFPNVVAMFQFDES